MNEPASPQELAEQRKVAKSLGLPATGRHIFLCCDQTNPKCCDKQRSLVAWEFLKTRLKELGLSEQGGVARTKANCLRICRGGPIAVVYPEGTWYGRCTPEALRQIVDEHLVNGRIVEKYLLFVNPLNESPTKTP